MNEVEHQAKSARKVSQILAHLSTKEKNEVLERVSLNLKSFSRKIVKHNENDIKKAREQHHNSSFLKRLHVDTQKVKEMISMVDSVVRLSDPIGRTVEARLLDTKLELYKVTTPIGVICAIFEARPDAVVQISSLCIKSGNAVILKGGSEASRTNGVLVSLIQQALSFIDPKLRHAVQLIETREDIATLLTMEKEIDLIIPRGSNTFVNYIQEHTKIPVLGHSEGLCHVYVDKDADIKKALQICLDSKVQYPAACNTMETVLIHKDIAKNLLPKLKKIYDAAGVKLRGCERTKKIIDVKTATEKDWKTEYNDLILSIKIVDSINDAINHINIYGSKHTDSIVTENAQAALMFINDVDSSSVFHNCSTRFSDGYRYGFGAEVGISTNKTHARGPVGLEGLTIYKYILKGNGHVVASYSGKDARPFIHHELKKKWS